MQSLSDSGLQFGVGEGSDKDSQNQLLRTKSNMESATVTANGETVGVEIDKDMEQLVTEADTQLTASLIETKPSAAAVAEPHPVGSATDQEVPAKLSSSMPEAATASESPAASSQPKTTGELPELIVEDVPLQRMPLPVNQHAIALFAAHSPGVANMLLMFLVVVVLVAVGAWVFYIRMLSARSLQHSPPVQNTRGREDGGRGTACHPRLDLKKTEAETVSSGKVGDKYTTMSSSGRKAFEWFSREQCEEADLSVEDQLKPMCPGDMEKVRKKEQEFKHVALPWTKDALVEALKKHKVDTECFGRADSASLEQLLKELCEGSCILATCPLDSSNPNGGKKLVRFVTAVVATVSSAEGDVLVQTKFKHVDGRSTAVKRLPQFLKQAHETTNEALRRTLTDDLGLPSGGCYRIMARPNAPVPGVMEAVEYPGLVTMCDKLNITIQILKEASQEQLSKIGLSGGGMIDGTSIWESGNNSFQWFTRKEVPNLVTKEKVKKSRSNLEVKETRANLEPLNPWTTKSVQTLIKSYNLEMGKGEKSIRNLTEELQTGRCGFLLDKDGTELVRMVSVVAVILWQAQDGGASGEFEASDSENSLLIETGHSTGGRWGVAKAVRWPGHKCTEGENEMAGVVRLLTEAMQIPMSSIRQGKAVSSLKHEVAQSASYPGLPTLYRKTMFVFEKLADDVQGGGDGDSDSSEEEKVVVQQSTASTRSGTGAQRQTMSRTSQLSKLSGREGR